MITSDSNVYTTLWSKYRPVILHLMRASATGAQEYRLSAHEFKAVGERSKSGYTFLLETINGTAANNIAGSAPARDLLQVLQQSKTGALMLGEASYKLRLDKNFVFHVSRTAVAPAAEAAPGN